MPFSRLLIIGGIITAVSLSHSLSVLSQNNALVIDGAAIVMNGGVQSSPIYVVVDQSSTSGIIYSGAGRIVSEGQYNYVKWNCATSTGGYTIPFGATVSASVYSLPFTFNKTTSGTSSLSVSTWHTDQQNMPHPGLSNVAPVCCMTGNGDSVTSAIDRFWDIQTSAAVTADLTFSYAGPENTTTMPTSQFKAQHWNGANWDAAVGPGNSGVTSGVGTVGPVIGQTTFSPWVLTRSGFLLPIDLLELRAECEKNNVKVRWSTATETNNDFFTVERSADAVAYTPIGWVDGAGHSTSVRIYEFEDTDPVRPESYYRLRQTDFNGFSELFDPVANSLCVGSNLQITAGSLPDRGEGFWLSINSSEVSVLSIAIYNELGQIVYALKTEAVPGEKLIRHAMMLSSGCYVATVSNGTERKWSKFSILK